MSQNGFVARLFRWLKNSRGSEEFVRNVSSLGVGGNKVFVVGAFDERRPFHCFFNDVGHLEEAAFPLAKGGVDDFICRVDDAWHIAFLLNGNECERKVSEFFSVRCFKRQRLVLDKVQTRQVDWKSLWEGEGELDGDAHVGNGELCLDGPVTKLDHAMDDTLRMNQNFDLLWVYVKKPSRFHDLESFVHHGGAVNCDFRSHVPIRIF